jgi:formylglycine-generating enzyme required for sulfatase activity
VDVYAVSIPGVAPAALITWFQAAEAARNAGKRLPTNAEWQAAALGTLDGPCNTSGGVLHATGATAGCVSDVGAFDMVGNLWEWVADWVPRTPACGSWGSFSDDLQCLAGAATTGAPGALIRGGDFFLGSSAGVFAVDGDDTPSNAGSSFGFRAAR